MFFKLYLALVLTTVLSFRVHKNENVTKRVTINGIAGNAKGNAVVVATDQQVYFLYGVERWHDEYYGKKVTVSGRLKLITAEKSPGYPNAAQWVGTRNYIKNPKWVLNK